MKQKLINLSQRYVVALEKHLKQGPGASLEPALRLGREAVGLGLETLELAKIHEQALATLQLSKARNAFTKLAGIFFIEANLPIEETHRTARQGKAQLSKLEETLGQRTEELVASDRQVHRGVVRRKIMEQDADQRGKHHQKSLEESLRLQKRLRQLTHRVMAAQEDDRKKISRELQDEIAQTLLGINIQLLSLKKQSRGNTENFKGEITSTQRLVAKSVRSVRQVAQEIGRQP